MVIYNVWIENTSSMNSQQWMLSSAYLIFTLDINVVYCVILRYSEKTALFPC